MPNRVRGLVVIAAPVAGARLGRSMLRPYRDLIRNDRSLNRIREYKDNSPARWSEDRVLPNAPPNPFNQWPLQ